MFDASTTSNKRDIVPASPEMTNRPPELDLVLSRFESPKLRLPPNYPPNRGWTPTRSARRREMDQTMMTGDVGPSVRHVTKYETTENEKGERSQTRCRACAGETAAGAK